MKTTASRQRTSVRLPKSNRTAGRAPSGNGHASAKSSSPAVSSKVAAWLAKPKHNLIAGKWVSAGSTVVQLEDSSYHELGPMVLRPDGTVIAAGATTNNAIYAVSTGKWTSKDSFTTGQVASGTIATPLRLP